MIPNANPATTTTIHRSRPPAMLQMRGNSDPFSNNELGDEQLTFSNFGGEKSSTFSPRAQPIVSPGRNEGGESLRSPLKPMLKPVTGLNRRYKIIFLFL